VEVKIFLDRNHLTDMEINPIMVRAQGGGVAAVDVRLVHK
jgi:succinyl-CoA synthetase beta subunit